VLKMLEALVEPLTGGDPNSRCAGLARARPPLLPAGRVSGEFLYHQYDRIVAANDLLDFSRHSQRKVRIARFD
jgi:hypothetical protein